MSATAAVFKVPKMKVLIISHWPAQNVVSRSMELAKELSKQVCVYWLEWDLPDFSSTYRLVRLTSRLKHWWLRRRQSFQTRLIGDIRYVSMPYVLPRPYSPLTDEHAWAFNRTLIRDLIHREGITHILNANARFFPTSGLNIMIRVVCDVVDDQTAIAGKYRASVEHFIEREMHEAHAVITVSHGLRDLFRERYGVEAVRIPNGGNPRNFDEVSEQDLHHLRAMWGLEEKKVIGCIGNHNHWAGLDLLVKAFALLRRKIPNSALLVVGPGTEVAELRRRPLPPGVIVTGPVPPERIAPYFRMVTVGTLPFTSEEFTENSLPLKILEYGFARKPVVATPLRELQTLKLPYIKLVIRDPQAWSDALEQAVLTPWEPEWDKALEGYAWEDLADGVLSVMEGGGRCT